MRHVLHRAIYREPVGMNVEYGHEYGNLQTFPMQYLIFHHLLDSDDRSIGGSDDQTLRIVRETPERTPEEIKYQ